MAKVSYAPDKSAVETDGLPENTTQFGYEFVGSKPVEVTDPAHLRKFAGHPHFKVSGDVPADPIVRTAAERESATLGTGSKETVVGAPNRAPVAVPVSGAPAHGQPEKPAKVTPGQADEPDGDTGLRAVHRSHGIYAVMDESEEVLVTGLSKDEAEDFNNLDGDAKAKKLAELLKDAE